jgi:hypothetical protein
MGDLVGIERGTGRALIPCLVFASMEAGGPEQRPQAHMRTGR